MKKIVMACLLLLVVFVAACAPRDMVKKGTVPSDRTSQENGVTSPEQQVGGGVNDVDALGKELATTDTNTAAGDLENLNW